MQTANLDFCFQKANIDQSSSFVWQVKSNISELPSLDMTFTFSYACLTEGGAEPRKAKYCFTLANFQVNIKKSVSVGFHKCNQDFRF